MAIPIIIDECLELFPILCEVFDYRVNISIEFVQLFAENQFSTIVKRFHD